jgi:small subunit ribosomal protein S2
MVRDTVATSGNVLFIGTKRQAQDTVRDEAIRAGMPYVTVRWLGGMLTNWRTIRQRINELDRLERMRDRGDFERITKKEALLLTRKIDRLETLLGGIRNMTRLPEMVFVIDVRREATAIHEANLLNIPVIALVDTNCDPRDVDYVIPSNDDAIRAIKLLVGKMAEAALEGRAMRKEEEIEEMPSAAHMAAEEPELADEDLLGEATLAKLGGGRTTYIAAEDEEIDFDIEVEEEEEGEEIEEEEEVEEIEEVEEVEEVEEGKEEAWEADEEIEEEFLQGEDEEKE